MRLRIYKKDGSRPDVPVHRLVAQAFIDNPKNKPYINHKDCNKSNNYYKNLEWVTHAENMKHASVMGRWPDSKGENHPSAKLTESDIIEIFRLRSIDANWRYSFLAEWFNVSKTCIGEILSRVRWSHIKIPEVYLCLL